MSDFRKLFLAAVAAILLFVFSVAPAAAQTAEELPQPVVTTSDDGAVVVTLAVPQPKDGVREAMYVSPNWPSPFPFPIAVKCVEWKYGVGVRCYVFVRPAQPSGVVPFSALIQKLVNGTWVPAPGVTSCAAIWANVYMGHPPSILCEAVLQEKGCYRAVVTPLSGSSPTVMRSVFSVNGAGTTNQLLTNAHTYMGSQMLFLEGGNMNVPNLVGVLWYPDMQGLLPGVQPGYASTANSAYVMRPVPEGSNFAIFNLPVPAYHPASGGQFVKAHITVCASAPDNNVADCATVWEAVALPSQ